MNPFADDPTPSTPLTQRLAARIAEIIVTDRLAEGARLTERSLAQRLRVSRSPVRAALRHLEAMEVVTSFESGGFVVRNPDPAKLFADADGTTDEDAYLGIAQDRLEGHVPDRITENELMRRYGLSRAQVTRMLHRIAGEGWIERLPGHGWEFLPMLTSLQSYRDSYRFRLVIEPAAILEENFRLDRPALMRCRDQQQQLVDGEIWTVSNAVLFETNSHLHEVIIGCSQNPFFVESLRRVDRLRRLIEYKRALDRKYAIQRCREHIALVDLLLHDKRNEASAFMRSHLSSVSSEKTSGDAIAVEAPATDVAAIASAASPR